MAVRITVDIPKELDGKLGRDKERTGLSKSYLIRSILRRHYATKQPISLSGGKPA